MTTTANTSLGFYDPYFYANEALIQLEKALGLAARVHRGYDKAPQQRGSIINIKAPATFSASDVNTSTGGTTQDLATGEVAITLNKWKEVKFALTDKELAFTGEQMISDHIRPAAYALADAIDQDLIALWYNIPWVSAVTGTPAVADITAARAILFGNKAPMGDDNLHMMVSGTLEAGLLNLSAFSQQQGAGDAGVQTQLRGSLGRKFGLEVFANQNVDSYTCGGAADVTGALVGAHLAGATTVNFDGVTTQAALKKGDTFVIAGHTQRYCLTADATATGGVITGATITPPLAQAYSNDDVITFTLPTSGAVKIQNLAFHRDAFALAMAPLSDMGNQLGAQVATVVDPITGLTLRSRMFYDGDKSTVKVALDCLYGVKTLNCNLACRMQE